MALLLVAFALRVYDLGAQSLWYDEAVTAQVVAQGVRAGGLDELARWTADDIQPPLYYVVVAGWSLLGGVGEWALRFPSAAMGLLMVPLAYSLAVRLYGSRAGLVAALLAAVHPLWVYYSQEARMYTLLTALGMLAGYALLRVLAAASARPSSSTRPTRMRWWAVCVGSSIALLYTHYFGAFLLLAYGIFFLTALLRQRQQAKPLPAAQVSLEGVLAALVVLLAYLPWLPNALRRFQEDASYWQGTLKLNEALRHLAISLTTGETFLEAEAIPLAWGMMLLAGLCLVALIWMALRDSKELVETPNGHGGVEDQELSSPGVAGRERGSLGLAVLFTTLYLLVPVASILLLSYRTPKFNPRYLMLASPAFVLLLAGGLSLPFRVLKPSHARGRSALAVARAMSGLALLAVLVVFLVADRNWFFNLAFTKDEWREAVGYVRSQLAEDEAVVLVSGHALPAWRYYAPEIEPVPLPEIEILDVNAVLGLNVARQLNQALAGRQGAWLVQWQEEVVDPTAVVPFLLGQVGEPQRVEASYWGLGRPQHFRFPRPVAAAPGAEGVRFPTDPSMEQHVGVNFGGQLELVGFSQTVCNWGQSPAHSPGTQPEGIEKVARSDTCDLTLFWRALQPLDADLKLAATLFDQQDDVTWSHPLDRRLADYNYPTFRWRPGDVVLSQISLAPDAGTPPGEYRLRLGVYDAETGRALDVIDEAGNAQGHWTWLEPIRLLP